MTVRMYKEQIAFVMSVRVIRLVSSAQSILLLPLLLDSSNQCLEPGLPLAFPHGSDMDFKIKWSILRHLSLVTEIRWQWLPRKTPFKRWPS